MRVDFGCSRPSSMMDMRGLHPCLARRCAFENVLRGRPSRARSERGCGRTLLTPCDPRERREGSRSSAGPCQIIEGWVAAVGMSRNEVFLNFGRDWRWDFTAAVDLKRSDDREGLVARLKDLKGRLVRVRGFIERRNGPFISLATAEAIEELPEGSAGGR